MNKNCVNFWTLLLAGFLGFLLTAEPACSKELSVHIGRVIFSRSQPDRISLIVSVFNEKGQAEKDLGQSSFSIEEHGQGLYGLDSAEPFLSSKGIIAYLVILDTREDLPTSLTLVSRGIGAFVTEMGFRHFGGILTYTGGVNMLVQPTKNAGLLLEKLNILDISSGKTFLSDGLIAGIRALERIRTSDGSRPEQTALILLTDGHESDRLFSLKAIREKLLQTQGALFVIGYGRQGANILPDLADLAEKSGGGFFFAHTPEQIEPLLLTLAHRLKHSYVLNFQTKRIKPDGGFHSIRVNVNASSGQASGELKFMAPDFGEDRYGYTYAVLIFGLAVIAVFFLYFAFRRRKNE